MLGRTLGRLPEPVKRQLRRLRELARQRNVLRHKQLESWSRDGFLILPGFFRNDYRVQDTDRLLDDLWSRREADDRGLVVDIFLTGGEPARVRMRDAPDESRAEAYKLNDVYLVDDKVRSLMLDERLLRVLRQLTGDVVVAINSLHFEHGSTQGYHFDTFFMPPPAGGQLIVTSICLEDVHPDAGPLTYYPGSHLIPPYRNPNGETNARDASEISAGVSVGLAGVEERNLQPAQFLGRKGDVFIWHQQLFHGGMPIADMSRTRKSLVTHYWTKGSMTGLNVAGHGAGWFLDRPHQQLD
jgi:phytanoyl-CoA hydroxylase